MQKSSWRVAAPALLQGGKMLAVQGHTDLRQISPAFLKTGKVGDPGAVLDRHIELAPNSENAKKFQDYMEKVRNKDESLRNDPDFIQLHWNKDRCGEFQLRR